ncbi:MAG: hypothetical protein ABSF43_13730 [Rectinemataceae bacterium]
MSGLPQGGSSVPKPTVSDWTDALLTSGTEALLGAIRNYIGPVKTPYDKRDLVASLEAFLRRTETRDSLFALLDSLDIRILGSSLLMGSVPEQVLRELFVGELPLFELGVRISNLLDRLLLFRYQSGGRRLVAVNPLLENELRARVLDPGLFFNSGSEKPVPNGDGESSVPVDAGAAVAFFSFLFHTPLSIRKGGGLTKRAAERAAALLPELAEGDGDRVGALALALSSSGILRTGDDDERCLDREAFTRLLLEWGEYLPYYLAACVGSGDGGGAAAALALVLACALEALPEGMALPRSGLARWVRIVARGASLPAGVSGADPAAALSSLEAFGILTLRKGYLVPVPPGRGLSGASADPGYGPRRGILVAEGSHALHLMPEASLEDRLFVGCVARPISIGKVWSFDVERETVRRAFAAGLSAAVIKTRFEFLAGAALPQSFAFSLSAWEEEYRSLRLFRGFVLTADERQRLVIERSVALGKIVAESLGPGVYFLSVATPDQAIAALATAGLEAPPLTQATAPLFDRPESGSLSVPPAADGPFAAGKAASEEAGRPARRRIDALRDLVGSGLFSSRAPEPGPEERLAALRSVLATSGRPEEERRELADRIERRLVVTERQIAQSDPRPERLEAGGLDYLGKVRVIERSLRAAGDRLEVLYRLPGEEPVRALLRPVRLDKNEKGLVLEAEDLVTGGPARVPLGAVSTVRRLRASLFGED